MKIRFCPNCASQRPADETLCRSEFQGGICGWDLTYAPLSSPGNIPPSPGQTTLTCTNGHAVSPGDFLCGICGVDIVDGNPAIPNTTHDNVIGTDFGGWQADTKLAETNSYRRYLAGNSGGRRAVITIYNAGCEPDTTILDTLRRQPLDHVPEIFAVGRWGIHAYDVCEYFHLGSLTTHLQTTLCDEELFRNIAHELGKAIASFSGIGLRHRNLCPDTVMLRTRAPLDLVIAEFGSARFSDFDLDIVSPLELTRYTAPETIVGGMSASSDWWSLGMILLHAATQSRCFEAVNEKAFLIHVVTRGVSIPKELDPNWRTALAGLLTRDPVRRWQWNEVSEWLAGNAPQVVMPTDESGEPSTGPTIKLGKKEYGRWAAFGLGCAEVENWSEAKDLLLRGVIGNWLEATGAPNEMLALLRRTQTLEGIEDDLRLGLALMELNSNLPLIIRGDILNPAWLLTNPTEGFAIVNSEASEFLRDINRELWIVHLRERTKRIQEKAKSLEIEIEDEHFRLVTLSTSRANLEIEWAMKRKLLPDTSHAGVSSILSRRKLSDEDMILLVCASPTQFESADPIVQKAVELAAFANVGQFQSDDARQLLERPREDLFRMIADRSDGFARCGNSVVDEWADTFRLEKRLTLPRALVLLSIPDEEWHEPPRQQYVQKILQFFEKRAANVTQRGPLSRLLIGKTTPRLDLRELEGRSISADIILQRLIERTGVPVHIGPDAFSEETTSEARLRRLVSHSTTYKRDTGIDGLYLGYPFLVFHQSGGEQSSKVPRIAPLLLWPIKISMQMGVHGSVSIEFDKEREEVRLNPALDGLLGLEQTSRWREALRTALEQNNPTSRTIIEAFSHLGSPTEFKLRKLPSKDYRPAVNTREIMCAGALLHAEFSGQAVTEDLRQLQGRPPMGTALETALRISGQDPVEPDVKEPSELDRHFTIDTDPSQEAAVLKARLAPGLLIEGPPGTGKSQTIVNIISDCIGRRETVLVVCQKLPALQVVAKRLRAEKLQDRFLLINNVNADRRAILQTLRAQVVGVRANQGTIADLKSRRKALAAMLEEVQNDLDQFHLALHESTALEQPSYRKILETLTDIENKTVFADFPALRPLLLKMSATQISRIREQCIALAPLWIEAKYENSALNVTKSFSADAAMATLFTDTFRNLVNLEKNRDAINRATPRAFAIDEISGHKQWREKHAASLANLDDNQRLDLKNWHPHFLASTREARTIGGEVLAELNRLSEKIEGTGTTGHTPLLFSPINKLSEVMLHSIQRDTARALAPKSFITIFNISRHLSRHRIAKFLYDNGTTYSTERLATLHQALHLEQQLRLWRSSLKRTSDFLAIDLPHLDVAAVHEMQTLVHEIKTRLSTVELISRSVQACPKRKFAEKVVSMATRAAFEEFISAYDQSFARYFAYQASIEALNKVQEWMADDWLDARRVSMDTFNTNQEALNYVLDALPTLQKYQEFRARSTNLSAEALAIFALFRSLEKWLSNIPTEQLGETVGRIIHREMILGWKSLAESRSPVLLSSHEEMQRKIRNLASWDSDLRLINQEILGIDVADVGTSVQQQWQSLTLLTGPNARRLREVFANGMDLGLLNLRPIWLMVPEVASQLLPLSAGLFDTVIFDEASQMPVEHSLPALYRGKRIVVSGDEKQMPPSNFFLSKIDSDEESVEDLDELEETATETERVEYIDTWNRREIKDYPDLLSLSRRVLPRTMLEIHYRSRYRHLIAFSNAAFYEGKLHIPVQHSISESKAARAIEVHHVAGQYESQVNPAEAKAVVERIGQIWLDRTETRPSLGIVTFNRKQADLIEELIEERAERDTLFREAWQIESDRQQDGEDMGFFVKNVENVQGDEREVIIFSSTFGRDASGNFRRSFGVLSQAGGERRLNVAVTRAKRKIILITSLPVGDISDMIATGHLPNKARDYLQGYFDFVTKIDAGAFEAAEASIRRIQGGTAAAASAGRIQGTARSIAEFLETEGIKVVGAHRGDMFGLDLAVEHPQSGQFVLGIECDSPVHPMLKKARYREVWRPKMLLQAIPKIYRISSRTWYEDTEGERMRLKAAVTTALDTAP